VTGAEPTEVIEIVGDYSAEPQASEQLASAAWINPEVEVELGCADLLKPPASIRITHRNIDGHSLSLRQLALMLGLPIGKRDNIVTHAGHVVIWFDWCNADVAVTTVENACLGGVGPNLANASQPIPLRANCKNL